MLFPLRNSLGPLGAATAVAAAPSPPMTNLICWLKADAGVYSDAGTTPCADGDTVRQWSDQSGNGNHAVQATAGNRPTFKVSIVNGLPVVRCIHSRPDTIVVPADFSTPPWTMGVVATISGSSKQRVIAAVNNNWAFSWLGGGRQWAFYNGNAPNIVGGPFAADTVWRCYTGEGRTSDGSGYLWENGIETNMGPFATSGPNAISIGGQVSGGETSDCDVAELLFYNAQLSDATRGLLEAYLSTRYSLGF